MKWLIFLMTFSTQLWAKPLVLISYFDAFNHAPFNNSQNIAKALEARFNTSNSFLTVKLCALNTIYDKGFAQTETCLKNLDQAPVMVIGLGESTCDLKIETMMRNKDKAVTADNAGNVRDGSAIVAEGPSVIGLKYPLPQMYCALGSLERNSVDVSNNAGTFVCNNTAYQMSYHYPEIQYGFIHVPNNRCAGLESKTEKATKKLEKMLIEGVKYLSQDEAASDLPHSSNEVRLPTTRDGIEALKQAHRRDRCLYEFFNRTPDKNMPQPIMGVMN